MIRTLFNWLGYAPITHIHSLEAQVEGLIEQIGLLQSRLDQASIPPEADRTSTEWKSFRSKRPFAQRVADRERELNESSRRVKANSTTATAEGSHDLQHTKS